jgi:hypothetical protein
MVGLLRRGERLLAELRACRARIAEARAYLDRPDANPTLGLARLEQLRAKHSGWLALLRAQRIEARDLLGDHESAAPAPRPARSA